jgi:redox-sensitive bicupin YhaK (pirin superfamily)
MGRARSVVASLALEEHRMSPSFRSFGLRGLPGFSLDPFLNVDDFRMSQPTFPPHPHAGFSAVTVMLEDSAGAFVNRDSLGDRSRIAPGGVHWTQAAAGMLHEEVPEVPGVESHGLQLFVNLRSDHKSAPPRVFRVEPHEVPVVEGNGGRVRILAGAFGGRRSPLDALLTPVLLLDVSLAPGARVRVPVEAGHNSFAMSLAGGGRLGSTPCGAHHALGFADDGDEVELAAGDGGLQVLVAAGRPLREPVVAGGPFVMNDRAGIDAAVARYRRGEMGALS